LLHVISKGRGFSDIHLEQACISLTSSRLLNKEQRGKRTRSIVVESLLLDCSTFRSLGETTKKTTNEPIVPASSHKPKREPICFAPSRLVQLGLLLHGGTKRLGKAESFFRKERRSNDTIPVDPSVHDHHHHGERAPSLRNRRR
jgi:hypothetical protein